MMNSFIKESLNYSFISWKRMIPAFSDTIVVALMGVLILKVASIVLISTLAVNIAFNSIVTLLILHNKGITDDSGFKFFLFKMSLLFSFIFVLLAIISYVILPLNINIQSSIFLLMSLFRPILGVCNIYYREILLISGENDAVHKSMNLSIICYIFISWVMLFILKLFDYKISILWLLIPVYFSIIVNSFYYKKN